MQFLFTGSQGMGTQSELSPNLWALNFLTHWLHSQIGFFISNRRDRYYQSQAYPSLILFSWVHGANLKSDSSTFPKWIIHHWNNHGDLKAIYMCWTQISFHFSWSKGEAVHGKYWSGQREFHLLEAGGIRSWRNKNIQFSVHGSLNGLSCQNEHFQCGVTTSTGGKLIQSRLWEILRTNVFLVYITL